MSFKNLLIGLSNNTISTSTDALQSNNPLYNIEQGEDDGKVWVIVSGIGKEHGDIALKQEVYFKEGSAKSNAIEDCYMQLVFKIFTRGAKTLNASHSGPFLKDISI